MCNLYKMTSNVDAMRALFGRFKGDTDNMQAYDAIYPNRAAPVLHKGSEGLALAIMTWGVPPPANVARAVTNVRNLSSPFWRSMLVRPEQRCLVPVTAFCEWTGDAGSKRQVWFAMRDAKPFAFAGIWRQAEDGPRMAFLTCVPNALVGEVHPKAMPVILAPGDHDIWLTGSFDDATALAVPYAASAMEIVDTAKAKPMRRVVTGSLL
jgi:putative SOS response-associated peptidase YedK